MAEPEDDTDLQAAELALGLLTGEDRAAALRRTVAEPAFADAVEAWRLRMAPLLDGIAPVSAPTGAWSGIERLIDGAAVLRAKLGRWRLATAMSSAVAAGLAALLVLRPVPAPPPAPVPVAQPQPMAAQMLDATGEPILTAQYDAATGQLRVRTANMPVGAEVPELWAIGSDGVPHSMGIVTLNGASEHTAAPAVRRMLADGMTIAVTMEPQSATPHAAPSGTIVGKTKLMAV
ncbi:anti-sigma factor domain-containing protein [Sphingomonas floccifaciens]|uniref:Anti-sigma factor domain-containing protein n=1 Tax=Sphingomonas floccifaciens TaxID=1844115 RepID=A0ABW4NFX7_9SPHN